MRKILVFCLVALSLPALAQTDGYLVLTADELHRGADLLHLTQSWRYHPGDDAAWAQPGFDDSDWEMARTSLKPHKMPVGDWPQIGWFRLQVNADSVLVGQRLALTCKQYGASEIYLDGQLLHTYGRIDPNPQEERTDIDLAPKPFTFTSAGRHVLAVRYANFTALRLNRKGGKGGFKLSIGSLENAINSHTAAIHKHRSFQFFFTGALLVFALFHLLMFFFYPALRRNLYYGIFIGIIALMVFVNFQHKFAGDLVEYTLYERLWRIVVVGAAVSGMRLGYSFIYSHVSRSFWFFPVVGGALAIASWFRLDLLSYIYIFVLIICINILRLVFGATGKWKRLMQRVSRGQARWPWFIAVGIVTFMLTLIYQIIINLGVLSPMAGFEYPYLFGLLCFLIPVSSAYVFYDYAQIHRDLERANRQLEQRVEDRTRQLVEAKKEADAANQSKSQLLANVSHEIRTPMNAILGYAQILQRRDDLIPDHRSALETIQTSGYHLLDLIEDVLELSRLEAGRQELHLSDFDLTHMLEGLQSMFVIRSQQQRVGWQLQWDGPQSCWVQGDEAKLRQVLVNLLGNAFKFTEQGEVTLKVEDKGGLYRFEVSDTGPGISKQEQDHIFESFRQGVQGANRGGTGLGLTIALDYVELMGGELSVESALGEGTRFAFAVALPAGQPETEAQSLQAWSQVKSLAPDAHVTALVADDMDEQRQVLNHLLSDIGVETRTVSDGKQVLAALAETLPDILFLGIRMQEMSGLETLAQIRADDALFRLKVVAVSASVLDFDQTRPQGFDDFIDKPFRFEQVYACLAELLGVQYVYKDKLESTWSTPDPWSVPLPGELRRRLCTATENRQVTQMESCFREMEALGDQSAQLAAHLRQLRRQHAMDAILTVLEDVKDA